MIRLHPDLAITLERPAEGRLLSARLVDYRLGVYAGAAHLEAFGPIEGPQDVRGRAIVTYVGDLVYCEALNYSRDLEKLSSRRIEAASASMQLELIRSGAGIGVLHDYVARGIAGLCRVLPAMQYERSYWLVIHADVRHLRRIEVVHDFLIESVRAMAGGFA